MKKYKVSGKILFLVVCALNTFSALMAMHYGFEAGYKTKAEIDLEEINELSGNVHEILDKHTK